MNEILKALQGKKTHTIVVVYILYIWLTSDAGDMANLGETLKALMVSTIRDGIRGVNGGAS